MNNFLTRVTVVLNWGYGAVFGKVRGQRESKPSILRRPFSAFEEAFIGRDGSTEFLMIEEGSLLLKNTVKITPRRGESVVSLVERVCKAYNCHAGDEIYLSIIHGRIDSVLVTIYPQDHIIYLHPESDADATESIHTSENGTISGSVTLDELQIVKTEVIVKALPDETEDTFLDRIEASWQLNTGDEINVEIAAGKIVSARITLYSQECESEEIRDSI